MNNWVGIAYVPGPRRLVAVSSSADSRFATRVQTSDDGGELWQLRFSGQNTPLSCLAWAPELRRLVIIGNFGGSGSAGGPGWTGLVSPAVDP
jgi:hypothetical protein